MTSWVLARRMRLADRCLARLGGEAESCHAGLRVAGRDHVDRLDVVLVGHRAVDADGERHGIAVLGDLRQVHGQLAVGRPWRPRGSSSRLLPSPGLRPAPGRRRSPGLRRSRLRRRRGQIRVDPACLIACFIPIIWGVAHIHSRRRGSHLRLAGIDANAVSPAPGALLTLPSAPNIIECAPAIHNAAITHRSGFGVSHSTWGGRYEGHFQARFRQACGAAGAGALTSAAWGTFAIAQGAAKVVIVGGGAGGATAAHFVKKEAPNLDVTLIEANSDLQFVVLLQPLHRRVPHAGVPQPWLRRAAPARHQGGARLRNRRRSAPRRP